jgi:hypothetical protein
MAEQRLDSAAVALGSPGERALETRLAQLAPDLPPASREYRFAPGRGYRFDFAWIEQRVACEVDGGQWAAGGGRHATDADRDKLNLAAVLGWRVLRFSPADDRAQPRSVRCADPGGAGRRDP